jgi:hypothetical protein
VIEFALDYSRASRFDLSHLWAYWILSFYIPRNAIGFYLGRPWACNRISSPPFIVTIIIIIILFVIIGLAYQGKDIVF